MNQILMAVLLIPMAAEDMKTKRLNAKWMLTAGGAGVILNIAFNGWEWYDIAAGLAVGGILIMISRLKASIGTGDGVLFLSAGLICGWEECIALLTGSLCCCLPAGVFLKLIRHKPGTYEIPFVPFVLFFWMVQRFMQIVR